MNEFLDIIENRLKFLFEDSFNLILKIDKEHSLTKRIPQIIKENLAYKEDGIIIAPDIIKITIPATEVISSPSINGIDYELEVEFTSAVEELSQTSVFDLENLTQPENLIPRNAFIIVNGKQSYPLDKSLVYVGRRSTSDIQIEDPQVSRDHLQLRANNGRYIVFDLDSTGGTFINGKRIKTAYLIPGDVITLGSSHLIYTQDMTDSFSSTTKLEIES